LGADWNIGKKTTIGGIVSLFDREWEMDAFANINQDVNGSTDGFVEMGTFEINKWTLLIGNVNIMHAFDDKQSLSLDIDHIDYISNNPTDYSQRFFDENFSLSNVSDLTSRKETPINAWVGKIDYTKVIDKISFEAGTKASFSSLKNDIVVENIENGSVRIDEDLTSHADMIENIGAGYAAATIDASDRIILKLGLRYEHTITKINTQEEGAVVNRNFGGWFPSVFFQNTINKNNSWVLSYSRRITRPSFFQIAPFVIFIDPYSFWSGNVNLLPSMTDAVKAEYKYKSILLSFQYSYDKNSIALFQPRTTPEGKQVGTSENMDFRNNYSVNLSLPFNITKWWEWQLNMSGNLINIKTDYLDKPVDITIRNFTINGSQKFSLPRQFAAEILGFYESKQLWGVSEMRAYGGVDVGLEKKFHNSQLRLAITDLFNTNKWYFKTNIPEGNLNTRNLFDFETRVIRITYSTSFGNKKLKVKKRDATGSEEEQRRFQ
jgi:outer membrane receptor protein involved in Fe transport